VKIGGISLVKTMGLILIKDFFADNCTFF